MFRRLAIISLLAACLTLNAVSGEGDKKFDSQMGSDLGYGLTMAAFGNRNFDHFEGSVDYLLTMMPPNDVNRIKLMMALAKIGEPQAQKALTNLKSWDDVYSGMDEEFRISTMADIELYYLDQPEAAAENYEKLIAGNDVRTPALLSSLFTVYSAHKKTLDWKKAEKNLQEMKRLKSPSYLLNYLIFQAVRGDKDEARDGLRYYESNTPPEMLPVARVYFAPVLGWLGETDGVVEYLEAGLKEQAIRYAPGGFRLYCDWIRQSPAYDSMRNDSRFIEMWERLYDFEPEGRGGTIMISPDGKGSTFIPEKKAK